MPNPFFSGRIPPDLDERIKQHIAETGESKTEVLINALATYLNYPVIRPAPATTSLGDEERFRALEKRVAILETLVRETSDKNAVIIADNREVETTTIPPDNSDNKVDNKTTIPDELSKDLWEKDTADVSDNKVDNITEDNPNVQENPIKLLPEHTPEKFERLTTPELAKLTGLRLPQIDGYKSLLIKRLEKAGRPFTEKTLLQFPEKIETRKPVTIEGYPYDLFYLGQNEKGKNLWATLPFDNERYQQLSLNNSDLPSN